MGQIFNVAVYDIENKKCFSEEVDKFHANCFSFSLAVCSTHYLLRKAPYRVMWCGGYVVLNDAITNFLEPDKLLGISVVEDLLDFQRNNSDLTSKPYYEQIKLMDKYHKEWNRINVNDEARSYFNFEETKTVLYSGYLLNHTKKLAINLQKYIEQSICLTSNYKEDFAIDLIPPLTETGGGTLMALFDGCSADVTEHLIGTWCGDLLQIVDTLPDDYEEIPCCFAPIWERVRYCKTNFGLDENQFVLKNQKGERFKAVTLSIRQKRGRSCDIKYETREDGAYYKPFYDDETEN